MPRLKLTEETLLAQSGSTIFGRGERYYDSGSVLDIQQRGQQLLARVAGSEPDPYQVILTFNPNNELEDASCTCPYGGWCKHVVATGLVLVREPDTIHQAASIEELLAPLDLGQTQSLLRTLMTEQPEWIEIIEQTIQQIAPMVRQSGAGALDPQPYRRDTKAWIRQVIHAMEEGYEEDPFAEEFPERLTPAKRWIEQGDGRNALIILAVVTEELAQQWDDIADYGGDPDYVIGILDPVWAEALLSSELAPEEFVHWQIQLEGWQNQLAAGQGFGLSSEALRQGWTDPGLVAVLQGESDNLWEGELWEGEPPDYAQDLAAIRLNILQHRGDTEAYLNLARAEHLIEEYLIKLVEVGRIEEVVTAAGILLGTTPEYLRVAQALNNQGFSQEALQVGQQGLELPPENPGFPRFRLAQWTSQLATTLGNSVVALQTRIQAFEAEPTLADYHEIQSLSGAEWNTLKPQLLEELRINQNWGSRGAKIDIFLQEGLVNDAIATLKDYNRHDEIDRVMTAAIASRPDWVIAKARPLAESIMNQGKADLYSEAVNWLKQAKSAYLQLGQSSQWQEYYVSLLQTHARKYKLVGLLKLL